MDDLIKIAEELSKKNSWIRSELGKFFDQWGDIDFGEELYAVCNNHYLEGYDITEDYCLTTGSNDLAICCDGQIRGISEEYYWYKRAPMKSIRSFCYELPKLINEIKKQTKNNINFEFKIGDSKITKVSFKCECGCTRLEEVMTDCIASHEITDIVGDANSSDCEYSNITIDDSQTARYQCIGCGKTIKNANGENVTTIEGVTEVLLNK